MRRAQDIYQVRHLIQKAKSHALVIAKIERRDALDQIDEILKATDGVMVARGDMAVELSPAEVPVIQKELVHKANARAKISIVATQMLESMISSQHPTRAEASDVANAIFDGADAVMLSGETAVGDYPDLAVKTMAKIIGEAERSPFIPRSQPETQKDTTNGFAHALARAATAACAESNAKAAVTFTLTGWSAMTLSNYRPRVPIYALTPYHPVYSQLSLIWGIIPLLCPLFKSTDAMLAQGEKILLQKTLLKKGEVVVIMAGGTTKHKAANTIKIHPLGS